MAAPTTGRRRVLVICHHFYPDAAVGARRISELALLLAREGWKVTVVAARPDPEGGTDPSLAARAEGLDVRRVPVPPKLVRGLLRAVKGLRRRRDPAHANAPDVVRTGAEDYVPSASPLAVARRWYFSLEWTLDSLKLWLALVLLRVAALRPGRGFDLVVTSGPPHVAHLAGLFARRLFGCPWAIDLRDPWIGSGYDPPHVKSRLKDRVEEGAERRCLAAADLVVCTAPGTAELAVRRVPAVAGRVALVYNGYDGEAAPPDFTPKGRLALLYAGSLYYNRNPFPFLEALREALGRPGVDPARVTLTLVGDCAAWGGRSVPEWAAAAGLGPQVRVLPRVPADRLPALTAEADVLVNFAQGQPLQIPAKTFEYFASGKEVLVISEAGSDTARLVEASGLGRVASPDDREGTVRVIRELYDHYVDGKGRPPPPADAARRYSRARQNADYLERLEALVRAGARGAPAPAAGRTGTGEG